MDVYGRHEVGTRFLLFPPDSQMSWTAPSVGIFPHYAHGHSCHVSGFCSGVGLFLAFLFGSTGPFVCPCIKITVSDVPKWWEMFPRLFLFSASLTSSFRNVFAILGLLLLYIYFRISLSNSSKMIGIFIGITIYLFPCGSTGKEYTCNVGDLGSIPRLGRSPGEGKGYSLQYSVLENSMDCMHSPWGHKELDTTERLSLHFIEHADN